MSSISVIPLKNMKDIIIIPTYNEKENIAEIISQVVTLQPQLEIWVVDDSSPDGTASIVSAIMKSNLKVKLIVRKAKTGLGDAYKDTLMKVQKMDDVRNIVTMDADGSHNPENIRDLLDVLSDNDLVIGSRYVRGGKIVGWGPLRFFLSYFGNIYNRIITGLPIKDGTAGFVAFRRKVVENIDFSKISGAGYAYQIEFKNALLKKGARYCEIPIAFIDRQVGKSKMSGKIVFEGLLMPWRILMKNKEDLKSRAQIAIVLILFIFGAFFATYKLTESPPVWYDEGWYYQSAANLADIGIFGLQLSPGNIVHISLYQTVSYPFIYPLALWLKTFGINILSGRSLMVIMIMVTLLVSYLLSKRLFGNTVAVGTLALLSTFAPLYGNGKSILGEVPGLLYFVLALLFFNLAKSETSKKVFWIILTGIFAGLCVATKPFFVLILPAFFVGVFLEWKRGSFSKRQVFYGILALLVPIIAWIFIQFNPGDSILDVITYYANPYAYSNPYYETNIFAVTLSSIMNLFKNASTFYTIIILSIWSFALFIKRRFQEQVSSEEIISFIFSVIVMLSYLRIGSIFRYFFPAQLIILIFLPSALFTVFNFMAQKLIGSEQRLRRIIKNSASIISIIVFASIGLYQLVFNSWVAEAYTSHKTAFWQDYFSHIRTTTSVFFYDTPEVTPFINHRNYYQAILTLRTNTIGKEQLSQLTSGKVDKVIVETDKYIPNKDTIFTKYTEDQIAYKYTILKQK
mgnify:CR=1 FL=1